MSYARSPSSPRSPSARALGAGAILTAPLTLQQETDKSHAAALVEYQSLEDAITKLQPVWTSLPTTPYPPASDQASTFPKSGTTAMLLRPASVSAAQLAEPAKAAAGLAAQASARIPVITPLFWIGLACLGAGIYIAKR